MEWKKLPLFTEQEAGLLKNELHRRLGKNQHVQYFKDAQKEKFGYGATLVKIK
jgi:DNA-nicking Smr family endonuclease